MELFSHGYTLKETLQSLEKLKEMYPEEYQAAMDEQERKETEEGNDNIANRTD